MPKKKTGKMEIKLSLLEWKLLQWMAKGHDGFSYYPDTHKDRVFFYGYDLNKEVYKAAIRFIEIGLVTEDVKERKGDYHLTKEAIALAKTLPKPEWKPPPPPKLTDRDYEVLNELSTPFHKQWKAPMDCGGRNGSYHSFSLQKLARHGYALMNKYGDPVTGDAIVKEPILGKRGKGSCYFQITEEGRKALKEWLQN